MKIQITSSGCLRIERKGIIRDVYCYHQPGQVRCGDWCPLFQEPEVYDFLEVNRVKLILCNITFGVEVQNFEDMR